MDVGVVGVVAPAPTEPPAPVPADDENCWVFTYSWNASRPLNPGEHHQASDLEISSIECCELNPTNSR